MKKVLVADDSLTIQKVIQITLSSEDFEIRKATNVEELWSVINNEEIDLLLLDYTLSSKLDGAELVMEIKKQVPEIKVILMLSTFDKVSNIPGSEGLIDAQITKPFDSSSFIDLCISVFDENLKANTSIGGLSSQGEDFDSWKVNGPTQASTDSEESDLKNIKNVESLNSELSDWGIEIPPQIGVKFSDGLEVPTVIGSVSKVEAEIEIEQEQEQEEEIEQEEETILEGESGVDMGDGSNEEQFPVEEDLGYPEEADESNLKEDLLSMDTSSELISTNDLVDVEEEIQEESETEDNSPDLDHYLDENSEDVSDFWSVDENISNDESNCDTVEDCSIDEDDIVISAAVDETIKTAVNSFNREDLINEIKSEIKNELLDSKEFVEEIKNELIISLLAEMKAEVDSSIEKVAWEVIPDLAENIIKSEIEKIGEEV